MSSSSCTRRHILGAVAVLALAGGLFCGGGGGGGGAGTSLPTATRFQRDSGNPRIVPGFALTTGGPTARLISDPSVHYDVEENQWKMWFAAAWIEADGTGRVGVKYAESPDGIAWTVRPEWALAPSAATTDWDHTHTETPSVVKDLAAPADRRYRLWYSGANTRQATCTAPLDTMYSIGLALSADGRTFTRLAAAQSLDGKAGLVIRGRDGFPSLSGVTTGVVADPDVVLKDGVFHMWCSSLAVNGCTHFEGGISYFTSTDGVAWTPSPTNPLRLFRQSDTRPSQPSVLWNATAARWEMWYNEDTQAEARLMPATESAALGFWYATSTNGTDWTATYAQGRDFPWNSQFGSEAFGLVVGTEVILKDGEYRMYYPAWGNQSIPAGFPDPYIVSINLATTREAR